MAMATRSVSLLGILILAIAVIAFCAVLVAAIVVGIILLVKKGKNNKDDQETKIVEFE